MIKKSFIDAFNIVFKSKFVFGSIGGVVAFFLVPKYFFDCNTNKSLIIAGFVLLAWYFVAFVISLVRNIKQWIQTYYLDNAHGDGLLLIKFVNEEINNYKTENQPINTTLRNICNETKRYFDKRLGCDCGVSIKLPKNPEAELQELTVENVARDDYSAKTRDTDEYKKQTHSVFGNTAYMSIITRLNRKPNKAYYLNNDIENDNSYENTSQDAYPDRKYPYASEFVFPIRSVTRNEQPHSKIQSSDITGFFCIDCKEKNKFNDYKYSVVLMKNISDGLYRIIQPK